MGEKPKKLFLPDGRYIFESELQYLGHGNNADVWKWKSKEGTFTVKTFYSDCYIWALDKKVANVFTGLNFRNLPNLYFTCRKK